MPTILSKSKYINAYELGFINSLQPGIKAAFYNIMAIFARQFTSNGF
jgi:hypothetical protein